LAGISTERFVHYLEVSMSGLNDALAVLFALRLEDDRRWREAAADWQLADAVAVLGSDREQCLHWFSRPKGASKSTDLAGFSIAWLVTEAPALSEGFAVAADEEQANRLLDKARGFVARTPELQGRVKVEARRIVGPNGARVQALAADVAGSEGLLTPWVVLDELPNWLSTNSARAMWTSIVSAIPKWKGMRLTVIGHAGDPAHWSYRQLEGARSSAQWNVHEIPGPLEWVSEADLQEQRRLLLPSEYARRHENLWVASEDRLASLDDLRECVTHDGPLAPRDGVRYVAGLDLGVKRDSTVLAVCHAEGRGDDRRVVVDRVQAFTPTRSQPVDLAVVEEAVRTVAREYRHAQIIMDPWQGLLLARNLRSSGVRVEEFTFSAGSVGRIALTLFNLLRDRRIALPDDADLLDELANVRLRQTSPGVVRLDHDSDRHDDRAVAVALAAHQLADRGPVGPTTTSAQAARRTRFVSSVGESRPVSSVTPRLSGGSQQEKYLKAAGMDPCLLRRKGRF
jgi:phage terminase large subunit-like protein